MKQKIGEKIAKYRKLKGYTQEQLAAKLNVSRQTIYKWEANIAIPRADHVMQIVQLFKISYDELFTGEAPVEKEVD